MRAVWRVRDLSFGACGHWQNLKPLKWSRVLVHDLTQWL
jgi:hypothetical protein